MSYLYEQLTAADMERRALLLGRYQQLGGYDGIRALFEYYSDIAVSTGEPVELDIVAICCDWAHFKTAREAAEEFGAPADALQTQAAALEWLHADREVLELPSGAVLVSTL